VIHLGIARGAYMVLVFGIWRGDCLDTGLDEDEAI
jgi:hypothetical protein